VLLAGFHPLILDDSQLQTGDECEVHVINPDEGMLLQAVDRIRPNVIVLDLLQTSSLRTIQRVRETSPSCDVVALTEMRRVDIAESIFSTGASGILYHSDAASELLVATRTVLAGQRYLSPTFTKSSTDAAGERSRPPIQLSASDELVLRLVARDFPAHRIAQALGLSLSAVRLSIACLKRQLDQRTNRGLKQYAATHDLASDSVMRPSEGHPQRRYECSRKKTNLSLKDSSQFLKRRLEDDSR